MSLIGTALLWSGWSTDAAILHDPSLVIKAVAKPDSLIPARSGTSAATARATVGNVRHRVSEVAEQIPVGSWTTYGDIAEKIGTIARNVANALRSGPIPNAHRILTVSGELSAGFEWRDGRTDDPLDVLKNEGIRFINGRADRRQRWYPHQEASLGTAAVVR
jgi:alkylated DNA nucleotide flippase Atl1